MSQRAPRARYRVIVVGGGHAGAEAAWTAANMLRGEAHSVALVTLRADTIGAMSCNPAIGGIAKGQMVREIDALGGLMGIAADATGIMFKMLNTSRGAAARSPRAQCDRHAYARFVRTALEARPEIDLIEAAVEDLAVEHCADDWRRAIGVVVRRADDGQLHAISAGAVVVTTGTFMRGLMHEGERMTPGGRAGEASATGIARSLRVLGFELGRLKTGTPPRLRKGSIDWESLEPQHGDVPPMPFSDLALGAAGREGFRPPMEQTACRVTKTTPDAHQLIRENLHRAPMFSGQIESIGPRYCPSIEDKVVRFAERESHHVFLEPESHESDWVYCNGIATSLPRDVQADLVARLPGCGRAEVVQWGYAVEYDMVRPHQIDASCMARHIAGLFFAGQINGTSGYEEAAGQGLVAGVNAVRFARGEPAWTLGRDEAYIGVMMDDLVTKTPVEPYRMFTSRAEHRLLLRTDNTADRLTPRGIELGLVDEARARAFARRSAALERVRSVLAMPEMARRARRPDYTIAVLSEDAALIPGEDVPWGVIETALAEHQYAGYLERERAAVKRQQQMERRRIPSEVDFKQVTGLRTEARHALERYRPATLGQAGRLEGVSPADMTLLLVALDRQARA